MLKTDKELFNEVFRALRKKGFIAKQNFRCCQSCGWAALPEVDDDSNVVFYHNQDFESFDGKELIEPIRLAWQGDGKLIQETFEEFGFNVAWDGTEEKRIGILPRKEVFKVDFMDKGFFRTSYFMNERELNNR